MPIFTSKRERRLWFLAFVVIAAIYATLAAYLRARNMLDDSFFAAFVVVVATIIGSGLVRRPRWREILAGVGIISVYVTLLFRLFVSPEERTHMFEYGLVATLIFQALSERVRNGLQVWYPAVSAVAVTAVFGWIDEIIQAILPRRVYDIRDVGFNALAGFMAVITIVILTKLQRRRD